MTLAQNGKSITAGVAVAIILAVVCLFFALWNPPVLLIGFVFAAVSAGLMKRRRWSAYGGAVFVLSLAAVGLAGLLRTGATRVPWAGVVLGFATLALAAGLLFRAGWTMLPSRATWRRPVWIAGAVLVFVLPQVMPAFVISGGSMENTLQLGDRILLRPLTGSPHRGDVVVLRYPINPHLIFIKRVVGVGGDRVRIENKQLIVNESRVTEPYVIHITRSLDAFRDNFPSEPNTPLPESGWAEELKRDTVNGELVVPQGKYFVLGDNRDNSLDSRYWGFLEAKDFIGKPALIYFSSEATAAQLNGGPFDAPPVLLHPSLIRWDRMLKPL